MSKTPHEAHPLPDSRAQKAPPMAPVQETNYQRLRALLAWLNYPEQASAVELGVSKTLLRSILNGTSLPDLDCQQRILVMSRRWPHGLITLADWPAPPPADRRK